MEQWRSLSGASKTAMICGLLGFVVGITNTHTSNLNGQITCSHMDYGALALGVIAGLAGGTGLSSARTMGEARMLNMAVSGGGLALGVIHVLRGIGQLGGPCG